MDRGLVWKEESSRIIGACFAVYNELGNGFLEAVYQECLALESTEQEIPFRENPRLRLTYRGKPLRQVYERDFLCFGKIVVEIKTVSRIADEHRAQVINYLKASDLNLGFLVNFGSHPDLWYQRFVNLSPTGYSRDPRDS